MTDDIDDRVLLGSSKITKTNYTRHASLPKILLKNMGVDTGDDIYFFKCKDGMFQMKPVKRAKPDAEQVQ